MDEERETPDGIPLFSVVRRSESDDDDDAEITAITDENADCTLEDALLAFVATIGT